MFWKKKKPSPAAADESSEQVQNGDGEPKSTITTATTTTTNAEEEKKPPSNDPPPVSFFRLFRFATKLEILANCIGVLCAIAAGAAQVRLSSHQPAFSWMDQLTRIVIVLSSSLL